MSSRRSSLRLVMAVVALAVVAASTTALPSAAAPAPGERFSSAELSRAKANLDARLQAPPKGIASWGVDPATGRVVVSVVKGDASAMAAAKKATADLPEATVTTVSERPRLFYNLIGGQAITSNGGRCSVGFSARSGSTTYVVTAGHCAKAGRSWSGYNGATLGTMSSASFPTDDFATIKVTSPAWSPTAQIQGTASVTGSGEAPLGASVCRSGSTTGYHCGVIQAKNVTVNYAEGVVQGLTKTTVCAEPGDSGGSFVSGRQAQGMTSGGSGNCTSGGTTYFQPVTEALTRYGLTLVTDTGLQATLCGDWKFTGTCQTVDSLSSSGSLVGSFVGDNALSSIRVPSNTWLLLYSEANRTGVCQAFNADVSFLQGTRIGNDTASSYQLASSPGGCPTS